MLNTHRVTTILSQAFPELAIDAVRYFAAGWDYEVWEVNQQSLFRFPLRPECSVQVGREVHLLQAMADQVPVAVPEPLYLSEGCEAFPMPFFGYEKVAGVPLSEAGLTFEGRESIGEELGGFLTALHSLDVEQAASSGIDCYDANSWREEQRNFHEKCRATVLPLLATNEREAVDGYFIEFLDVDEHFRFEPVLIHRDLGEEHVLVDEHNGRMRGVIDFADAAIGDPAIDFAGLGAEDVRFGALRTYECSMDASFDGRIRYYWKLGPFHEVLYGLGDGTPTNVEAGLRGVRERVLGVEEASHAS